MAWYIDSWAVLDGLAFVSRRAADSVEAEDTVFFSVPDLEPIPIGRISTALRAQRASFQDGFRDADGNELALETLEQVREVIRRAYLGGGLGPVAAIAPPDNPLLVDASYPPEEPAPAGGGALVELAGGVADPHLPKDFSALAHPDERPHFLESLHERNSTEHLYHYIRAFGEATLLEFLHERWKHMHHPDERATLSRWVRLLVAIGLWDGPDGCLQFLKKAHVAHLAHHLVTPSLSTFVPVPPAAARGLLFRIPCPLRPDWNRHIHTLGDKILLPLVDRDYFRRNHDLPEFIPLLLCSLVIAVTSGHAVDTFDALRLADRYRLLGRALWWIDRELPKVALPDSVEEQLSLFAWMRLEQNPTR